MLFPLMHNLTLPTTPTRKSSPLTRRPSVLPLAVLLTASVAALCLMPSGRAGAKPRISARGKGARAAEEAPGAGLPPVSAALRQRLQHLARLGADRWHAAGHRGQGVKIAILDTGWKGYRTHLGKALPARVTVRSFRRDGNLEAKDSQHGILCAEVIHAIAPQAELLFANWDLGDEGQYLSAVRWAREQGAKVISCSVIAPSWSDGEGGGSVHQRLAGLLGPGDRPGDLLCFASAGNTTHRHWGGAYREADGGCHAWSLDEEDNGLFPWSSDEVWVELYTRPGADYELTVYEQGTGKVVARGETRSRAGDRSSVPVRFFPRGDASYFIRVRHRRGKPGNFHVTTLNASLQRTTPQASVCFPGDAPRVVAMGAVDLRGQKWWYSACGPNSVRPKPDLVAVIPFPSLWRPRPFCGTSCAAPQAAALAALLWSRHPGWTANEVRAVLQKSARDLHAPGPDILTGYGLISLPPGGRRLASASRALLGNAGREALRHRGKAVAAKRKCSPCTSKQSLSARSRKRSSPPAR